MDMVAQATAGVLSVTCLDTRELYHDPYLLSRGFVHELDLPGQRS